MTDVNATLLAVDGAVSRPVEVGSAAGDFGVNRTGAATQATLAAILTALTDADESASLAKLETIRALLAGTLTTDLPTGAATSANQSTANTTLASILTALTDADEANALAKLEAIRVLLAAPLAVTGPLTDAQLAARVNSDFAHLLKFEPLIGEEILADDVSAGDRYHGAAPDNTSQAAASWKVVRFYRDASANITRVRYRTGVVWTSRSSGWT